MKRLIYILLILIMPFSVGCKLLEGTPLQGIDKKISQIVEKIFPSYPENAKDLFNQYIEVASDDGKYKKFLSPDINDEKVDKINKIIKNGKANLSSIDKSKNLTHIFFEVNKKTFWIQVKDENGKLKIIDIDEVKQMDYD